MVALFLDDNKTNDGDGKEISKNWYMCILTNNNFARASRYFVHFFAVVAPLRHETSYFHKPALWSGWTQHKNCPFHFLNLDNVRYGPKENFTKICNFLKLNETEEISEVWNSANRLLSDFFGLAMWQNDFSSLLISLLAQNSGG